MSFITSSHTFIIAEIGTAHSGSFEKAKELVDAAVYAGADCVKFQIVYAHEILHPDTGFVQLPTGNIPLYKRFKELEVSLDFYRMCNDYCKKRNILFSASPFGLQSLKELADLNPAAIKIASPELNHFPLLQVINDNYNNFPLILSSGVSKLSDIEKALEATECVKTRALLHCITAYPAPEEEYNLKLIKNLSSIFGVPVGVSDHSMHPVLVPVISVACGGSIIEKHICLSRKDSGLDDPVALEPDDFAKMVKAVRKAEKQTSAEIIAEMSSGYGEEKVLRILGTGKKELAPAEKQNYTRTNRSIHFMRSMKKGEVISANDIAVLRTEKILSPGISPEFYNTILGAELARDVQNGNGLVWSDVIN